MTISLLKPIVIKPKSVETPQCCVEVDPPSHAPQWRRDRYKKTRLDFDPNRCQRESVLAYDGKCYCRIHAGKLALTMWLDGKLIEKEIV